MAKATETQMREGGIDCRSDESANTIARMSWLARIERPVDGASLAAFRIAYSVVMLFSLLRFSAGMPEFMQASYHFSYFANLPFPDQTGMTVAVALLAFCLVNIGIGMFYRVSCCVVFSLISYYILLDKSFYQNQIYLADLLAFVLLLVPANRVLSVDNSDGAQPRTVPAWSVHLVRLQIASVYFFMALSEFNSDWMNGYPQFFWMFKHHKDRLLGPLVSQPYSLAVITFGGLFVNFFAGIFLAIKKTSKIAVALIFTMIGFGFAALLHYAFFWLVLAALLATGSPSWPRFVLKPFVKALDKLRPKGDNSLSGSEISNAEKATPNSVEWYVLRFVLPVFVAAQILLPLRQFMYPPNSSWNQLGTRFSWCWEMPLKDLRTFKMTVTDPMTGAKEPIDARGILSDKQYKKLWTQPDLIWQFANHIADQRQTHYGVRPLVSVKAVESLYDRRPQDFIDPDVNLASQPPIGFKAPSWLREFSATK